MEMESLRKGTCQLIRVKQDTFDDAQLEQIGESIGKYLEEGARDVALVFEPTSYPYSKVISYLIQFRAMIEAKAGTLTIVQPNEDFQYVLETMSLGDMVRIVSSEERLPVREGEH